MEGARLPGEDETRLLCVVPRSTDTSGTPACRRCTHSAALSCLAPVSTRRHLCVRVAACVVCLCCLAPVSTRWLTRRGRLGSARFDCRALPSVHDRIVREGVSVSAFNGARTGGGKQWFSLRGRFSKVFSCFVFGSPC